MKMVHKFLFVEGQEATFLFLWDYYFIDDGLFHFNEQILHKKQ